MQSLKRLGNPLSAAHFLFLLVADKRVPWLARGVVLVALIYTVGPIDLIPDTIPIVGFADDIAVVLAALFIARMLTPDEIIASHPVFSPVVSVPLLPEAWVLADDRMGNTNQSLGVAERLDLPLSVKRLRYDSLISLPNVLRGRSLIGLDAGSIEALRSPWPSVVVAAGRRSAPVARYVKMMSEGRTKIIQLMDPDAGHGDFDLIVLPRHDRDRRNEARVVRTTGAVNRVTPRRLQEEGDAWRSEFAELPRPWVALLVGGDTRAFAFSDEMATELGENVSAAVADLGGSLLVTTSRRTRPKTAEALLNAVRVPRFVHLWAPESESPFFAFLALCDQVVVTGDSVSMCTEACTSGKPVYIFAPSEMNSQKHQRLVSILFDEDFARPFDGHLSTGWSVRALNSTDVVASAAADVLGLTTLPADNRPSA